MLSAPPSASTAHGQLASPTRLPLGSVQFRGLLDSLALLPLGESVLTLSLILPSLPTRFASLLALFLNVPTFSNASVAASKTLSPSAPLRFVPSMPRRAQPGSAKFKRAAPPTRSGSRLAANSFSAKSKSVSARSLRALICGSAPLGPKAPIFPDAWHPVLQAYGLTETTASVRSMTRAARSSRLRGPTIRGIEMKAAGNEEIVVRGPHIFSGYWNRPEETARVLRDGWFHTEIKAK